MMKVILTNSFEEAQQVCADIDLLMGYPDLWTSTYTSPVLHANKTQWIVQVPGWHIENLTVNKSYSVIDIDPEDIYQGE